MPLTRPIPKAAYPVLRVLRRDVKRPRSLPRPYGASGNSLRFLTCICPMGLHPDAVTTSPIGKNTFPVGPGDNAIATFGEWWDEQTDARAATDAVWPRKKPRKPVSKRRK